MKTVGEAGRDHMMHHESTVTLQSDFAKRLHEATSRSDFATATSRRRQGISESWSREQALEAAHISELFKAAYKLRARLQSFTGLKRIHIVTHKVIRES